jgi:GYF domain 2
MTGDGETGFRWFYVQEGRRKGPLALAELVALILGGDLPEDTLIWHAGLAEWVKANSVEEIQRELPPPIPGKEADQPDEFPAQSRQNTPVDGLDEAESEQAESEEAESDETEPSESSTGSGSTKPGGRRRRRHRPRYRLAAGRRRWLAPLIVMLIVVVFVLWYLLRRFNEVPQGQVIFQGALSEVGRPVAAPLGPPRPDA